MKILVSSPKGRGGLVAKECKMLHYTPKESFDSGTYVEGDMSTVYMLNIRSRVANKVYIVANEGKADTFDQLFDLCSTINWSDYIKDKQNVHIESSSKKSYLTSIPTIQRIVHKAITKKLTQNIEGEQREVDTSIEPLSVFIHVENNKAQILVNTSGKSLHERAYREQAGQAPIKENIAAALILQSGWKFSDTFLDPFCGSGTFCIEAAMIARNIAPGLHRYFLFELFPSFQEDLFNNIKEEAKKKQYNKTYTIIGSDIDPEMTAIAQQNAKNAGVEDTITFITQDFTTENFPETPNNRLHIVTNPPYGKRINPENAKSIIDTLARLGEQGIYTGGFITLTPPSHVNKSLRKTKPCYNGPDLCTFFQKI